MHGKRRLVSVATAVLAVATVASGGLLAGPAARAATAASPTFTIKDLGTLGGQNSYANAINNSGQVVGSSETASGQTHAFVWSNGTMTDLGTLGGTYSVATDINNSGQVVGYSTNSAGQTRGFLWSNGTMTALGTLGGTSSEARGISDSGVIVGSSTLASGDDRGFRLKNGTMETLGTLGTYSTAYDVDQSGDAVGVTDDSVYNDIKGFMWNAGTSGGSGSMDAVNDGLVAEAYAVANPLNAAGQTLDPVTGHYHAAYWWWNHTYFQLNDLGTLGGTESAAWSIGYASLPGQSAGYLTFAGSSDTASGDSHAWMIPPGQNTMVDMGTLTGAGNSFAHDVNTSAVAAGSSQVAAGGAYHAVTWTPQQ